MTGHTSTAAWRCSRRCDWASSRVNKCAAARVWLLLEIHVGQRMPVGVADDEARPVQPGVRIRQRTKAAGSGVQALQCTGRSMILSTSFKCSASRVPLR